MQTQTSMVKTSTRETMKKSIMTDEYAGARPKSEPQQSDLISRYQSENRRKTTSLERKSRQQKIREASESEIELLRDQVELLTLQVEENNKRKSNKFVTIRKPSSTRRNR